MIISVVALAGCYSHGRDGKFNSTGKQIEKSGASLEESDPYAPVEGKKYKITMVSEGGPYPEDADMVKYWNELFNVEIVFCKIDESNWDKELNTLFASGKIPDKITVKNPGSLYSYYVRGLICEIPEDVFKRRAPNYHRLYEEDVPGALIYGKIGGKLYGLPRFRAHANYRGPLITRKDWLDNVGYKVPDTLDELGKVLYSYTYNDPDGNDKNDTYGLSSSSLNAVYGSYGYIPEFWAERDGYLTYGAIQPEMKDALALLRKWYADGVIDPEFVTGENKGGYWALSHSFLNGQIGLTGHGNYYHWCVSRKYDYLGANPAEFEKINPELNDLLINLKPPTGPEGKHGTVQENIIMGSFLTMGKHLADQPDKMGKILQIFDYVYDSYEHYITARRGIEGLHWKRDEYGKAEKLFRGESNVIGAFTSIAECEPLKFWDTPYYKEFAEENGYDSGGIRDALLAPLPSMSMYWSELEKLREKTYLAIITGNRPLDYFDEFIGIWRASGGDVLTGEANKWHTGIKNVHIRR